MLVSCYRGPAGTTTGRTTCGIRCGAAVFTDDLAKVTCTDCKVYGVAAGVARWARGDSVRLRGFKEYLVRLLVLHGVLMQMPTGDDDPRIRWDIIGREIYDYFVRVAAVAPNDPGPSAPSPGRPSP